ncbi:MAG: M2 family metallopeptidase [Calditrichaeota bacterium]|nr:M2 family metallopeptidase [Calditrichota bacterium]MCB0268267.1 M2 family metallopeptidase [Calditrichota bacterium]
MKRIVLLLAGLVLIGCADVPQQAQQFLDSYTSEFQKLYYASAKAEWRSNTYIVEGDNSAEEATKAANEALANFTGSKENIETARELLKSKDQLTPIQIKQLEAVLYAAANNPQTVPDLVKARIAAEAEQNKNLFGFDFQIHGESVSTNEIDNILKTETNESKRLAAWEASKEVGKSLKDGLANLQKLRNETVQALGYDDYFAYQVSSYGMTTQEMVDLNKQLIADVMPLYRELHTYARYEFAKKYRMKNVPDYLPAHWLPNRWGQDWNAMVEVEGLNLDNVLAEKGDKWLIEQAERFYISMGFEELPESFWELSSLYPLPEGSDHKKNNHASAWHMDLEHDIRCLMSVVPNTDWYETTHHELGHIYYYVAYTNPDVPPLLREGANRAFHEAVGSLLGLAAMQKPFMAHLNLIEPDLKTDEMQQLLKEALNYIVFIPFSAGVMTGFEHELYSNNLPKDQYNAKWWELKKQYQGIVPPGERGEEYCDAASKTHISNDAAQYYDYALSYVQLFQLHNHIATKILKQDPRATNYYGSKEVGEFLNGILKKGASEDWRKLMQEELGEELSAKAMLNYFAPLMDYLKEVNKGRKYTL